MLLDFMILNEADKKKKKDEEDDFPGMEEDTSDLDDMEEDEDFKGDDPVGDTDEDSTDDPDSTDDEDPYSTDDSDTDPDSSDDDLNSDDSSDDSGGDDDFPGMDSDDPDADPDSTDDSEDDSEEDPVDGEESLDDSENLTDDSGIKNKLKNNLLLDNYRSMYNMLSNILEKSNLINNYEYTIDSKLLHKLQIQINTILTGMYDYIINLYSSKSYEENLYTFYNFQMSIQIITEIFNKLVEDNEKESDKKDE